MNTKKGRAFKITRYFVAIGILVSSVAPWGAWANGKAYAAPGTAAIGGSIYTGAQDSLTGLPIYAPDPAAPPIAGATVMIQNEAGDIVGYPTVTGNAWSATVDAPGEYIVMFSAPGHDATSRAFEVVDGDNLTQDAYLPPLPLPLANLLVYAFTDNYVNGEDDFPDDPGLAGVTFHVYDEAGNEWTGMSGASPTLPPGAGPDPNGLYYFTGLPPGEVKVCADPPTLDWYLLTTEEGTHCWENNLYPGDPGTEAGLYLDWFGYVPKLGQLPPSADAGSISGTLKDADGNWFADEPLIPCSSPVAPLLCVPDGVTPNDYVPNGLAVLFTDFENTPVHPVATAEADASGNFTFDNVPPGRYKIHAVDVPLNYIYVQQQVSVAPGTAVIGLDIFVPRFYARANGYVKDTAGNPIAGATVNLRLEDGSIWKETTTDADGWYNFDTLEEVEITGHLDVTLPPGYHGQIENVGDTLPGKAFNLMSRDILWFTMNYRANLTLEAIPAGTGNIAGMVFYDHLEQGTWVGNGLYEPDEEGTIHGATVELYDSTGTTLLDTTTTGQFSEADALAQGWIRPYTCNPGFDPAYGFVKCNMDEFGRVIKGAVPGYYEFRGLTPGDYVVKVIPPFGFSASPAGSDVQAVAVADGARSDVNLGVNTLAPLAGEVEGGVFDDLNLDEESQSLLFEEKAGVPGVPVGVYDHLGYFMGDGHMGDPRCYTDSTVCPGGGPLGQKPEVEIRTAPGVHRFYGNDPSLSGYNPCYDPLYMSYEFHQGGNKFEADWSLLPVCFAGLGMAQVPGQLLPNNAPVINAVLPGSFWIHGQNFGATQGNSTVTLSGQSLPVMSWTDTLIHAETPPNLVSGPLTVATSTGISNAMYPNVTYTAQWAKYMAKRSVYVDAANTGAEDGSKAHPWNTIGEALNHLPSATPRYVFVAAGTYHERVKIPVSNVRLIGAGPRETTIDGLDTSPGASGKGPTLYIGAGGQTGGVSNIVISGFTVTGGSVNDEIGAGVFGDYGNNNIDINNSIIARNGGYYGGGIWLHKSNHNVKIWSNLIAENGNTGGYGGGISVNDEPEYGPQHGEPEHILDDHALTSPPGTYRIFNNLIFHNFSPDYGGGLALYEVKDKLLIYGNVILENKADDHGGGAFFEDTGPVELYSNIFLRNYSPDDGGAVSFEDVGDDIATVKVYNNLFAQNIADDRGENHARGGALAFDDTLYASVYNNTIVGNIVAGSIDPAGGGLDSERNGHEYVGKAPGFSDPKIFNNILWGNWRLQYDQPAHLPGEDLPYTSGVNYQWTPSELHVDNPGLQPEWQSANNSESFTYVKYNDIRGGYLAGLRNLDIDPLFVDPLSLDWHLQASSPVINKAPTQGGPTTDLELRLRNRKDGKIDLGAYEWFSTLSAMRIPSGILGAIEMPGP
ncbi:MAG: carboxypeptidase regulatory-like domain-containing protein [Chloroflexi bacterium]|nr:carboxypeptidase regulatory-like domain-containing protein [Chloroflexota bacterium]